MKKARLNINSYRLSVSEKNAAGSCGVLVVSIGRLFFSLADVIVVSIVFCLLPVCAASVSDNAYSETVVNEEAGDILTEDGHVINETEAAEQMAQEIQTNSLDGWPEGPAITAASAILMDADSGTILYGKNVHEQMYPASTTKLMTCLIAAENLNLSDNITFSESAISAVPADGSNIGMSVGETITVEQCLYGLMVGSGNECANALAEAVSGSIDAFVDLMNERAVQLGCTDSHFVNANGLHDDNHYTSAYDLALIAQAFFQNEVCLAIGNTASYQFTETDTQPDSFTLTNKHELITGEVSYSGIIGGKTGYTSQAHENLVTGCEQNGITLICVVMREDDPAQFDDTVTLFDYGYSNFIKTEAQDVIDGPGSEISDYLTMGMDLLGSSTPALSAAEGGEVIIPLDASKEDLTAVYASDNSISYYYGGSDGVQVGTAVMMPSSELEGGTKSVVAALFEDSGKGERGLWSRIMSLYISEGLNGAVYVNVFAFLVTMAACCACLTLFIRIHDAMRETRERTRQRRRRVRRTHVQRNDYYENHRFDRSDQYYGDDGYEVRYHGETNYREDFYGSNRYGDDPEDW